MTQVNVADYWSRRHPEAVADHDEKSLETEVSAALALYHRRIALLWEPSVRRPEKLRGIYQFDFAGAELAWPVLVKLVKMVKAFDF